MKRLVILLISLLILLPSFALGQYQGVIVSDTYTFNGPNNNKENVNWGEANLTLRRLVNQAYSDEISEQATNESNFSATATGYRHYNNGYYQSLGGQAYFWASTNENDNNAWRLNLSYNSSNATLEALNKRYGFSIRCLKD